MDTLCTELKGVGEKVAEKLAALNIHTIRDLLFHLPARYEDRTTITPIKNTKVNEPALIQAKVISGRIQYGRRRSFICNLEDDTGSLHIRLFYFGAAQAKQLATPNVIVRCYGVVRLNASGREMIHPEYKILKEDNAEKLEKTLTPVYPTTAGVTQNLLKKIIKQVLKNNVQTSLELLPDQILSTFQLPKITDAIKVLHSPGVDDDLSPSVDRLAFEELLAHHLTMKYSRAKIQENNAYIIAKSERLLVRLIKLLPFSLTQAQQKVFSEIEFDLAKTKPMMRLVQGDVGCGKTVVALMAALSVVELGKQVAFMAPTEILAEQHYKNFASWCEQLDVKVVLLSGSMKAKEKRESLDKILIGTAHIIIGTHALFQESVVYHDLAMVIIDEQHRFGVHQRLALYNKGKNNNVVPHQLVMTATPIPRSLAMTAYAELDCSIIDELPPGRTPVLTVSVDNQRRNEIIERIASAKKSKQQVYWVCTLIDESDTLQCQAAENAAESLRQCLPDLNVALVHGRMKPSEKDEIMTAFKNKQSDILVATTVIEVGVDVPNATLMVIENAERLGLSQLHQLRGRVGRGAKKSYCVLLYQSPLTEHARARIKIMRKTNDGFEIADQDLLMRGPGELLGTRQTGAINFKIADLLRDQALLPKVHQAANLIIQRYPDRIEEIIARWHVNSVECAEV